MISAEDESLTCPGNDDPPALVLVYYSSSDVGDTAVSVSHECGRDNRCHKMSSGKFLLFGEVFCHGCAGFRSELE